MSMENRPFRLTYTSPLGLAFFSDFNRETVHQSIISAAKAKTGVTIAKQNDSDLQALMRSVYTDLVRNPNENVRDQVSVMNAEVTKRALGPISTGIVQQANYLRDISSQPVPMPSPESTSTYGNKIPSNFKFGIY